MIKESSQEEEVSVHGVFSTHLHTILGQCEIIIQTFEHFDIIPVFSIPISGSYSVAQGSCIGTKLLGSGLLDGLQVIAPEPQAGKSPVGRFYLVITRDNRILLYV